MNVNFEGPGTRNVAYYIIINYSGCFNTLSGRVSFFYKTDQLGERFGLGFVLWAVL